MLPVRLQITLITAVVFYFFMMCVFLKNKSLSLKYTLLWLFAGGILGALVMFPGILTWLNGLIGIQENMAIAFIVCILLSLTSIVSRQNHKIRQLIQTISRLENRIRELERQERYDTDEIQNNAEQ